MAADHLWSPDTRAMHEHKESITATGHHDATAPTSGAPHDAHGALASRSSFLVKKQDKCVS